MGVTLYCGYYPNKCNDEEILPFLSLDDVCRDYNGKHLEKDFYDNCRELAIYYKDVDCYVFTNADDLFKFASRTETPSSMSDYISENYQEGLVFIIWVR